VTLRPTRKRFISLSFIFSAEALAANSPLIRPTRTPAIGPLNGASDISRAADAPIIAATSESFSLSTDSTVATICVSE
jgi:hypothetical protein